MTAVEVLMVVSVGLGAAGMLGYQWGRRRGSEALQQAMEAYEHGNSALREANEAYQAVVDLRDQVDAITELNNRAVADYLEAGGPGPVVTMKVGEG